MKNFLKNNTLFYISIIATIICLIAFFSTQKTTSIIDLFEFEGPICYLLALSCAYISFKIDQFEAPQSKAKLFLRKLICIHILSPSILFLLIHKAMGLISFVVSIITVIVIYPVYNKTGKSFISYFFNKDTILQAWTLIILVTLIMVLLINIIALPFNGCDSTSDGNSSCWVCGGDGRMNGKKCGKCDGWGFLQHGIAPHLSQDCAKCRN